MTAAPELVRVDGLSGGYGGERLALSDVGFAVRAGESLAVLGPNGGGKTTLFRALLDELPVRRGEVALAGRPAYVPQGERTRLDFPVSALDVSVRAQILDLLAELAAAENLALVLVSHDLGVVRYLCEDVVVLHDGAVAEHGRAHDVLVDPQDDYTKRLVAAVPKLP